MQRFITTQTKCLRNPICWSLLCLFTAMTVSHGEVNVLDHKEFPAVDSWDEVRTYSRPHREATPTNGGGLAFPAGSQRWEKLLTVPLIADAERENDSVIIIEWRIRSNAPTAAIDNDLTAVISAGNRFVGVTRAEQTGGTLCFSWGTLNMFAPRADELTQGPPGIQPCISGVGLHDTFSGAFTVTATSTAGQGRIEKREAAFTYLEPLPRDQAIAFELMADNATETYDIHSLEITISTVPRLADSTEDFSDRQAANGWSYGYYDRENDSDKDYDYQTDFSELRAYDEDALRWYRNDSYWTMIAAEWTLPNSSDSGNPRTHEEHWSIRRWVSDISGSVLIQGSFARARESFLYGPNPQRGDGVTGRIAVDGVVVWDRTIGPSAFAGEPFSLELDISMGSVVDFIVTPHYSIDSDWTSFAAAIGYLGAPQPITICPAAEVKFATEAGMEYLIEESMDLSHWMPLQGEGLINPQEGTGNEHSVLVPLRRGDRELFYRVRVVGAQ